MHANRFSAAEQGHPVAKVMPPFEQLLEDQSQRWRRGDRLLVEAYVEQQPALREDEEQLLDMLYHEILLRTQQGESPGLEEYLRRFPEVGPQLRTQFEVHEALSFLSTVPSAQNASTTPKESAMAAAPLPSVPGYEVLAELGRGGMGVVYQARQIGLNRLVALKMIRSPAEADGEQVARFRSEAEAVARLQHPNIIQIHEIGTHAGVPYFSLELLTGGSLEKMRGTPLAPRLAARLTETLARAMEFAHQRGIVHRDLKPANVLLTADGVPKITDFGLAKRLDVESSRTRDGVMLGTPSYMAPEQTASRREAVSPAVDVYALGAILYELLTGRPPFRGETVMETVLQVAHQEVVPPRQLQPKVPRDLETICLKCLRKDPARRFASALNLAEDLRRFQAGEPILARPTPGWERAWKGVRRRPALAAACGTALLVLTVLAVAHEVRLKVRLEEAREAAGLAELREGLLQVDAALNSQHWSEAQLRLTDVNNRLAQWQEDPASTGQSDELRHRAARAQRRITNQLTDQDRYQQLAASRDGAVFYALGFAGLDVQTNLQKSKELVERTVQLFAADESGDALPVLESSYFTSAMKNEIREGCFELLLDLAHSEAEATPRSGVPGTDTAAEMALNTLNRAAHLGIASGIYHQRRARYLARLGHAEAAAQEREHAQALPPTLDFEHFLTAFDLYQGGQLVEAIGHCDKALALRPNHFGAQYLLAACYLKLRVSHKDQVLDRAHLATAKASLNACIYHHPSYLWTYLLRGFVHGELDEFEAALADFARVEELLQTQPEETAHYGVFVNRGVVRIRQGKFAEAVQDLSRAVRLRPTEYNAYVDLAQAYQGQQRWSEARAQLDKAIALNPSRVVANIYRNLALLDEQRGDVKAALHDLEQAIGHEPGGPLSSAMASDLFEKGRLLLKIHEYKTAADVFGAALLLQPDNPVAYRRQAEALLQLGRFREAIQALNGYFAKDVARRKAAAAVYRARALAHAEIGQHAAAAEDYTHALELEPVAIGDCTARGWEYVVLEAPVLALRDFEKVVQLDPNKADGYSGRGYAKVRLGQYLAAVLDAEKALRLGPPDARLSYNTARIYAQASLKAEAESVPDNRSGRQASQRYQDRAVELLRRGIDSLPFDKRGAFWRETVQHDTALNPLRASPEFQRLAGLWTRSKTMSTSPK